LQNTTKENWFWYETSFHIRLESRLLSRSSKEISMKKVELLQKLNRQGAVFARHGGGGVYLPPRTSKEAAVPRHDEINEYTAKAILKKLS
jgi:hypothetical protein